MNSPFFEKSQEIADKFIQNVLFVDDEIYPDPKKEDTNHNLDAQELVNAFSKAKKLCALNNPRSESDLNAVIEVAKKADISVLDWKMDLPKNESESTDEEADVDEDDPRGTFTLRLISEILSDDKTSGAFKLILIYTGEVILNEIVEKIRTHFKKYGLEQITKNIIGKQNIKIIVAGKPSLEGRLNHAQNLKKWIIPYSDIPNFLLSEFAKMTEGIVSNVALQAITSIRSNTFKLLSIFNKEIDPAFLSHRALLTTVDDAGELLKDSLLTSFRAILDYDEIESSCNYNFISKWINQNDLPEREFKLGKQNLKISKKELKEWQKVGFIEAFTSIWNRQLPNIEINDNRLASLFRSELHKTSLNYYLPKGTDENSIEEKFSILTHHKSNHAAPSYVPKLTLGSIVKGSKSEQFWICIQQKCDSIRIKEEARRFLFLPLVIVNKGKKFNILINQEGSNVRLLVDNDTHKVRTIKFKANKEEAVFARRYGSSKKYFFKPLYSRGHKEYQEKYDEKFIWVMDLKDDHAQRIAHLFASKLSRVGLDESEWLRRWSDN